MGTGMVHIVKTDCHLRVKKKCIAIYEYRGNQTVTLYKRSTAVIQSGMYCCDIAVSGSGRGTVYVGLYETGGIHYCFSCSLYYNGMQKNPFHCVHEI